MTPQQTHQPTKTPLHEARQQLVGGKKSSRVIFSYTTPGGYAVKIDGEFLRRSGERYTTSNGWKDLPEYVQKEGKKVLDGCMKELANAPETATT